MSDTWNKSFSQAHAVHYITLPWLTSPDVIWLHEWYLKQVLYSGTYCELLPTTHHSQTFSVLISRLPPRLSQQICSFAIISLLTLTLFVILCSALRLPSVSYRPALITVCIFSSILYYFRVLIHLQPILFHSTSFTNSYVEVFNILLPFL